LEEVMPIFRCLALIAFLVMSALGVPQHAFARQVIPPQGGSGDAQRSLECPPGEFLRGVTGRTGLAIDAIGILCAPGHSYREYDPPHAVGDVLGGAGGGPNRAACPDTQALNSIAVGLTPGRVVEVFELTCQNHIDKIYFGPNGYSVGGTIHNAQCSGDEAFTGLVVNYGRFVNAIGFICDTVPYMSRGFGTPSAPPSPVASGPGLAPRSSIAGVWSMTSTSGNRYYNTPRHFQMQIIAQGDGLFPTGGDIMQIGIVGVVDDSDGVRDGVFNAVLEANRQMIVNFTHKDGTVDTCLLTYSADGQNLGGQCANKDRGEFQWYGTRGSGGDPGPH
jgi:hypothetical protein